MLDKNEISRIRALCDGATDGKWVVDDDDYDYRIFSDDGDDSYELGSIVDKQDAEFIAQSRAIISALLDEIERLQDELDSAKRYIAHSCNTCKHWKSNGKHKTCDVGGCKSLSKPDRWEFKWEGKDNG